MPHLWTELKGCIVCAACLEYIASPCCFLPDPTELLLPYLSWKSGKGFVPLRMAAPFECPLMCCTTRLCQSYYPYSHLV